ncbi:unnamed protein product [Chondrus crispus]|uniref:Uncharacterized protein n=1 Tax=Chondrus crispus TaxID=2769 RepID=R7Q2W7_CHOCR|nr:unnamed protein product [Chondrus crispus]CDF32238.1 unnamed protein product [Chondrus crispus]|eukprot:XP_005711903.1 unnamed protein product [Chondrus crispus]
MTAPRKNHVRTTSQKENRSQRYAQLSKQKQYRELRWIRASKRP